jgi:DNA-binding NarL/FixJ family response regulator
MHLTPLQALDTQEPEKKTDELFQTVPELLEETVREDLQPANQLDGHLPFGEHLTRREVDVLRLLAQGLSNAQIAEQLVLRVVTVNSYLRSVYSKLGVSSRTAAIRYAWDYHLI